MTKAFDDLMCKLGLEYFVTYGTLLGLHRSDRLIPWTIDNDFIATTSTLQYLIDAKVRTKEVFEKHGLCLLMDNFICICPTPAFVGGKLAEKMDEQYI
jgi:phosphorylcholine metabolism protein LicD